MGGGRKANGGMKAISGARGKKTFSPHIGCPPPPARNRRLFWPARHHLNAASNVDPLIGLNQPDARHARHQRLSSQEIFELGWRSIQRDYPPSRPWPGTASAVELSNHLARHPSTHVVFSPWAPSKTPSTKRSFAPYFQVRPVDRHILKMFPVPASRKLPTPARASCSVTVR